MLIESFFCVKRDEKEDISSHVAKLQKLFVDLNEELTKHKENTLSERILNGRILSTLGKEFDNFKDIWDTIPSENQKLNLLIEKLCTIELRDQSSTEASAFVASGKRKQFKKDKLGKPKLSMERAKQKFPCNKCKQVGHWAAECPQKKIGGSNYQAKSKNFRAINANK
ncbi:Zinc knuckle [Popillia japonica]|uniref:Zinc knuckle n=1 Tax=Popillia japonica TaxID=7064 RepID=A0AAW1JHT7_POPJA